MARWRCRLLLLLALAAVRGAPAADAAAPGPAAEYRFAPGDVIEVTVTPQRTFDRTVTVQPDGKITFPIIGQVEAAGQTVKQLAEILQQGLNQELVDPVVSVSLREASRREIGRISLLGAVRSPGGMEIKEGMTLTEVLAAAGGPADRADLQRITITGTDGTVRTIDLSPSQKTGRADRSTTVQPGDIVIVPEKAAATVLVLGAVEKPGSYPLPPDARLLDVIGQAGGMTTKADLRRVMLARAGVPGTRILNLQPLLARGETSDPELNQPLQAADTLFIPETENQVLVLGSVARPGVYAVKPTDRVLDALVQAGGAGGGAGKAMLVRKGSNGQPVSKTLDLKRLFERGDPAVNEALLPGDMLYVPDKKERRSTLQSLNLLWPLTGLYNLFRN